jgi:hypothetical protein
MRVLIYLIIDKRYQVYWNALILMLEEEAMKESAYRNFKLNNLKLLLAR